MAEELSALSAQHPGKISIHQLDVDQPEQIDALAAELRGETIDILVNNAGILGATIDAVGGAGLGHVDYDVWSDVLRINTMAPLRISEALLEPVARSETKFLIKS